MMIILLPGIQTLINTHKTLPKCLNHIKLTPNLAKNGKIISIYDFADIDVDINEYNNVIRQLNIGKYTQNTT